MAVIHDVAALAITVSPTALQCQQMGGPEVKVEPVIMQPDAQAVTDQAVTDQAGPFWQGWTV